MAANRVQRPTVYRVYRYYRRSGGGGIEAGPNTNIVLTKQENPVRQWISSLFHKPPETGGTCPPSHDNGDKEKEARERLAQIQEREARLRSLYLESQLFQPMVNRDE